jgi:hypothetical protein
MRSQHIYLCGIFLSCEMCCVVHRSSISRALKQTASSATATLKVRCLLRCTCKGKHTYWKLNTIVMSCTSPCGWRVPLLLVQHLLELSKVRRVKGAAWQAAALHACSAVLSSSPLACAIPSIVCAGVQFIDECVLVKGLRSTHA